MREQCYFSYQRLFLKCGVRSRTATIYVELSSVARRKTCLLGCARGRGESRVPEYRMSKKGKKKMFCAVETVSFKVDEWDTTNRGERGEMS